MLRPSLPAQERYTDLNEQDQDPPEASEGEENTEELKEAVKKVPIPSPSSVPQVVPKQAEGPSAASKLVESLQEELRVAHARIKELEAAQGAKASTSASSKPKSAALREQVKALQEALAAKKLLGYKTEWLIVCVFAIFWGCFLPCEAGPPSAE